jgi:hypothetical protein
VSSGGCADDNEKIGRHSLLLDVVTSTKARLIKSFVSTPLLVNRFFLRGETNAVCRGVTHRRGDDTKAASTFIALWCHPNTIQGAKMVGKGPDGKSFFCFPSAVIQ